MESFEWRDIPSFSVITGLNGSGKSQLLKLIEQVSTQRIRNFPGAGEYVADGVKVLQSNLRNQNDWSSHNVKLLNAGWQLTDSTVLGVDELANINQQFISYVRHQRTASNQTPHYEHEIARIELRLGRNAKDISDQEIAANSCLTSASRDYDVLASSQLSSIFLGYYVRRSDLLNRCNENGDGCPQAKILHELGEAPWDAVNALLEKYGFLYRVIKPETLGIRFQCKFRNVNDNTTIDFSQLSSGEQMVASSILWAYNSDIGNISKLILMDEPDAYLHPSMTKMFIEIVRDVLVGKYGIQVIMTSHSPSTVALVPEENLFIMDRNGSQRIRKSQRKEALKLLTSNLLVVTEQLRIVIVEADDDQVFYTTIYETLKNDGVIKSDIPVVFKSVNVRPANSGGCTVVRSWVDKFSALEDFVLGIVDRDGGQPEAGNIKVISRYSIENYMFDPLVIIYALYKLDLDYVKKTLQEIGIANTEKHQISSLGADKLEAIIEKIHERVFGAGQIQNRATAEVFGKNIQYPSQWIETQGHSLRGKCCTTFPGLDNKEVFDIIRTYRVIPRDLADTILSLTN